MSKKLNKTEMDSLVKEAIRECLKLNPQFTPTNTLVVTTYNILKTIFVDEIKYVFLEAPTGSGKSVISYMTHFCYVYIERKMSVDEAIVNGKLAKLPQTTYIITSSKMLQEQIDGDILRFNLEDYLAMIKGVKNYECTKLTKETGTYHNYTERFCIGQKTEMKQMLPCYETCPYIQKRYEASGKDCTILNYSYFLNALKNPHNVYFQTRPLTIADEAHLIPDIVLEMYNISLTMFKPLQIQKLMNQISMNFNKSAGSAIYELMPTLGETFQIFLNPSPKLEDFIYHIDMMTETIKGVFEISAGLINDPVFEAMFKKELGKLKEDLKNYDYTDYFESLKTRQKDVFIKSELIGNNVLENMGNIKHGSYKTYKHNLYDLSESELCRKHFISKLNVCVFMSATLGNIEEFAHLMGLKEGEYTGFRLSSNFDFSKSPIYLAKSGYLNYNNFAKNIDKVLLDTLRVSEHYHSKEKGIIHTSTFQIASLLKEKIYNKQGGVVNPKRYLFYETSEEKEACIELMKAQTNVPYVIVGPSLYEGIDLKQDSGRFNIIVKTPYSGIDDYIRKKMEIYNFWYERQTLEKLVQAIGRTNREVDDWSKTYIMDSVAEKIVFKMPEFITSRIQYFQLR